MPKGVESRGMGEQNFILQLVYEFPGRVTMGWGEVFVIYEFESKTSYRRGLSTSH